jgi:hypothetical protein
VSLRISPCIQGITQAIVPETTGRDVKIEVITPFHVPNHCSSQLVRGLFIPEFLASSFDRAVRPWRTLVMVPSGAVLLGMNV